MLFPPLDTVSAPSWYALPSQNNLLEMWALFNYCAPDVLGSASDFKCGQQGGPLGQSPQG